MAQSPGDFTLSAAPDAELVKHIQERDQFAEDAIRVLYNRHSKELWRRLFLITKDSPGSEDLVQNFFTKFWIRKSPKAIENFAAYMHGSVKNLVSDYYQSHKSGRSLALYLETIEGDVREAPYLPSIYSAEEIICANDLLKCAIDSLSDLDRQCFVLSQMQGLREREIADILNISTKQVSKHICSARKRIRAYMRQ